MIIKNSLSGEYMTERPSSQFLNAINMKFPNLRKNEDESPLSLLIFDEICKSDKNAFLDMYNRYVTGITDENAEVSAIKETTSKGITYDYVFITELYIEINGKHTTLYYYLTRKSTRNMKKWK